MAPARSTVAAAAPVRWWLATLGLAVVSVAAPVPAWVVEEFYARDLYPQLQWALTAASNLAPVAVLDVIVVAAALLVCWQLVLFVGGARKRGLLTAAWDSGRRLVRAVSVVLILFLWTWGCNYRRQPLETALAGGAAVRPTVELLEQVIAESNALGASLQPAIQAAPLATYEAAAAVLQEPLSRALASLNRPALSVAGRPKVSLVLTPFFHWAGVNGMVDPFVLESIVSPDLLPVERPFVLAHEWAHLSGLADEAEASAVGWLACMRAGPAPAYSASLYLITEAAHALGQEPRRRALAKLNPQVRSDLDAIARRVQREEQPTVQAAASRVYDQYLRANRVPDGLASYGRALTLILSPPIREALTTSRERVGR